MKKFALIIAASALCLVLCSCGAVPQPEEGKPEDTSPPAQGIETDIGDNNDEKQTPPSEDNSELFLKTKALLQKQGFWSSTFLAALDYSAEYDAYLANGGTAGDADAFADYLANIRPAPENWKEMFEKDLLNTYSIVPDHYEDLGNGEFQVYANIDGNIVPYVAVYSRTGWFHG